MNRVIWQENVFLGDNDRLLFLKTLGEIRGMVSWQIHSYCLMSNQLHLVVETQLPEP